MEWWHDLGIEPGSPISNSKCAITTKPLSHKVFIVFFKYAGFDDRSTDNAESFLRATAGTAIARLSHRNSVRLSVRHTGGSGKNGAS